MSKRLRLFMAVLLVVALSVSLFAGCSDKESTTSEQGSTAEGEKTNGEGQGDAIKPYASDKVVELSWLMRDDEQNALNVSGQFFDDLEKLTGVRVKAIPVLPDALQDRLNLAVASKNLPDIVQGKDTSFFLDYGQRGAFIPLDDLIDKYAPNIKEHMNDPEYAEAKYWTKGLDGKQYVIPTFRPEPDFSTHFMIRQDWLDKLNLKMPNNIDEFYNVLKTFKEKDPAGDGNTIPLSSMGVNIQQFYVLFNIRDDFFIENGEVKYGPADTRYKQALEWLNKFYKEGLLHQEVFSLSEDQYYEDVYGGNVGVGHNSLGRISKANKAMTEKFPDKGYKFTLLPPMESITGQRRTKMESALDQPIAISSNCKYPDVAIKLLDFFFTRGGTLLATRGISTWEGIEGAGAFEIVEDMSQVPSEYIETKEKFGTEDTVFVKAVVDDPTAKLLEYGLFDRQTPHRGGGGVNSATEIDISQPPLQNDERINAILTIKEMGLDKLDLTKSSLNAADFTFVKFTSDQNKRATELSGPIDSLVEQYEAKFVVGSESLDKWDDYIAQLKQLGIDELLSIYNEGYKQYMGQQVK